MNDPARQPDRPEAASSQFAGQFAGQLQRDLQWIALSPWLLRESGTPELDRGGLPQPMPALALWPQPVDSALHRWFDGPGSTDAIPRALKVPSRLGRYAEILLRTVLANIAGVTLIAANVAVRRAAGHGNGVDTLGELDFVWRDDASGEIIHWELATKFYLLAPEPGRPVTFEHFVGPNLADRFGDKLRHIALRQLPLSTTVEAIAVLGRPADRAAAYLKGWLFYPLGWDSGSTALPSALPSALAPGHLQGWWGSLDQFAASFVPDAQSDMPPDTQWCVLPRAGWLSPARLAVPACLTHAEIIAAVHQRFHSGPEAPAYRRTMPVMVCGLRRAANAGADGMPLWEEVTRGFIVPDGWEHLAMRRAAGEVFGAGKSEIQ